MSPKNPESSAEFNKWLANLDQKADVFAAEEKRLAGNEEIEKTDDASKTEYIQRMMKRGFKFLGSWPTRAAVPPEVENTKRVQIIERNGEAFAFIADEETRKRYEGDIPQKRVDPDDPEKPVY